jgi:hypothetical protein
LVTALLIAGGAALLLARRLSRSDVELLHLRHGDRLVAAQVGIPDGRLVSDVDDPQSLGAIAEHYDRVILHAGGVYLVDDGVTVYRYRAAPASAAAARAPSVVSR